MLFSNQNKKFIDVNKKRILLSSKKELFEKPKDSLTAKD